MKIYLQTNRNLKVRGSLISSSKKYPNLKEAVEITENRFNRNLLNIGNQRMSYSDWIGRLGRDFIESIPSLLLVTNEPKPRWVFEIKKWSNFELEQARNHDSIPWLAFNHKLAENLPNYRICLTNGFLTLQESEIQLIESNILFIERLSELVEILINRGINNLQNSIQDLRGIHDLVSNQ